MEFSWNCPSCLFSELLLTSEMQDENGSDYSTLIGEILPLPVMLCAATRIRLLYHNIQKMLSKCVDVTKRLKSCLCTVTSLCYTDIWLKPDTPLL